MRSKNQKSNQRRKQSVFIVPPEMRGTMSSNYEREEIDIDDDPNDYVVGTSYKGR